MTDTGLRLYDSTFSLAFSLPPVLEERVYPPPVGSVPCFLSFNKSCRLADRAHSVLCHLGVLCGVYVRGVPETPELVVAYNLPSVKAGITCASPPLQRSPRKLKGRVADYWGQMP